MIRNHGPAWNDLGYTLLLWVFVGAPLVCVAPFSPFGASPPRTARECLYLSPRAAVVAAERSSRTHHAQSRVELHCRTDFSSDSSSSSVSPTAWACCSWSRLAGARVEVL